VSKEKINKTIKSLGKIIGKDRVFYLSSKDRSGASLLINSNGDVVAPIQSENKTKDITLGNLLNDEVGVIFKKWNKVVDYKKYECHKCALRCLKS
jgi:hypothetical protein